MPTGYTADVIEKDISFREFALKCMRAFGALVSFRDDDSSKIITEVPLDSYHKRAISHSKSELTKFDFLTKAQQVEAAKKAIHSTAKASRSSLVRAREENARLNRMYSKVRKWQAPTPDHERYKEFMLEQLTISVNDLKYYDVKKVDLSKKAVALWIANHRAELVRSIAYHEEQYAEDVRRNIEANAWIKAIVDSLPE